MGVACAQSLFLILSPEKLADTVEADDGDDDADDDGDDADNDADDGDEDADDDDDGTERSR